MAKGLSGVAKSVSGATTHALKKVTKAAGNTDAQAPRQAQITGRAKAKVARDRKSASKKSSTGLSGLVTSTYEADNCD